MTCVYFQCMKSTIRPFLSYRIQNLLVQKYIFLKNWKFLEIIEALCIYQKKFLPFLTLRNKKGILYYMQNHWVIDTRWQTRQYFDPMNAWKFPTLAHQCRSSHFVAYEWHLTTLAGKGGQFFVHWFLEELAMQVVHHFHLKNPQQVSFFLYKWILQ